MRAAHEAQVIPATGRSMRMGVDVVEVMVVLYPRTL
jgi:hypothetical protein